MIGAASARTLLALAAAVSFALLAVLAVLCLLLVLKAWAGAQEAWRRRRRKAFAAGIEALLLGKESEAIERLRPRHPGDRAVLESMLLNAFGSVAGPLRAQMISAAERLGLVQRRIEQARARSPHRRAAALEALGRLGSKAAMPSLLRAFREERPALRSVAARALGRVGDPAALPILLDALGSLPPGAARPVAQAVYSFGETAVPALLEHLSPPDPARGASAELLGRIRPLPALKPLCAALAEDPDPAVRRACAEALGRMAHPDAVGALRAALRSPFREVRAAAAWALGRCGDPAAVPELEPLLGDAHTWTALRAAEALARLGVPGRQALARARERDDERARRLAGEMLALPSDA